MIYRYFRILIEYSIEYSIGDSSSKTRGPTSVSMADEQKNKRKSTEKPEREREREREREEEEGMSECGPMRSGAKELKGG